MEISLEDFNSFVPSAVSADSKIYIKSQKSIERRLESVRRLIVGRHLFDRIDQNDDDQFSELRKSVIAFSCVAGFLDVLPQLDLVVTPNGFGVVSNQNVVPASKERVESLRVNLDRNGAIWLDLLLEGLSRVEEWTESPECRRYCQTVLWRPGIAGVYSLYEWEVGTGKRLGAHLDMCKAVGAAQGSDLVRRAVSGRGSISGRAVAFAREFMFLALSRESTGATDYKLVEARRQLVGFLIDNIDSFPVFKASSQYKALKSENYENKSDDPGFVFY